MIINSVNFCNSPSMYGRYGSDKITKKLAVMDKKAIEIQKGQLANAALAATVSVGGILYTVEEFLKQNGFTYSSEEKDILHLASGYNGGFFSVNTLASLSNTEPKEAFATVLAKDKTAFGGLMNYVNCVRDLKRQDLINKALRVHTYEMSTDVETIQKYAAAKNLAKFMKRKVNPDDLFYLENDAFYYDMDDKTIYGVNLYEKGKQNLQPTYRVCKFDTDARGCVTGYSVKDWNYYQRRPVEDKYSEQSAPSEELNKTVDVNNNKALAEAFRFGNDENEVLLKKAAPQILNHLSNRVKVKYPYVGEIKYVKFRDNHDNIVSRFSFYDSSTGRSLVYDKDGKYMYQMEYNKDGYGNIIACGRF